ncbi:hypothetical protein GCM10023085_75100 [Actinomadura viridis]|uniref:Uncharacterized protein n=1 Tax=Actinomadura viridis TaxID=58110 RepID=A0A931DAI4_9ACTN|nr:hypothetical protein [Actinomadura viridis]MBG6086605.1 hypothetical protein [Actinomadura viridis]
MLRHWTRLGLVLAMAGCAAPASSALGEGPPRVDAETERQLTVAARTLLQARSQALVQQNRHDHRRLPDEILGVAIAPGVARVQERAVRELETRNRAPVEGGPAYTGARTRLAGARAVRVGDRITLEAVEHTEVRYETGKVTQSVRRSFEFVTRGERITLTGERVMDPGAHPFNDPDPR